MNSPRIINLFSEKLRIGQTTAFRYKLSSSNQRIKGLLISNDTVLSISFHNQDDLEIESLNTQLDNPFDTPPAQRIFTWEQEITDCSYITGTVQNKDLNERNINLYILF